MEKNSTSEKKSVILVVEDQEINRKMVCNQLSDSYTILEAANGQEALDIIGKRDDIGIILLDIVMPVMDGWEFLKIFKNHEKSAIPVIILTSDHDAEVEYKMLEYGALDFIVKPCNAKLLRSRIDNVLVRNPLAVRQRMEFVTTHDNLTKLYNRGKMFEKTREMLIANPDKTFAFVRLDIDKLRLYNSTMGEREGDKLICYLTDIVRAMAGEYEACSYGHMEADIFCMCYPYSEQQFLSQVKMTQDALAKYRQDYVLKASFGIYVIPKGDLNVEMFFARASMAADKCKNTYNTFYAYYDESISQEIFYEQSIINDMRTALEKEQFQVYLQPRYDLQTDLPCGAEALVRWLHPKQGLIMPGKFIPVFEKNGFIANLDYYMWEHTCMLLSKWKKAGKKVMPVSVNMSRASLFNPRVDELIIDLVKKYNIPQSLLNLEVTESTYMSDPELMKATMERLQKAGFVIMMDDFGTGYSSLNTLKDINIDVLKLDILFMPKGNDHGKSEKILSSLVRMAGWLGMSVIAEGVETLEQKQFLESIGCGYVQGYYYAKPMPVSEYEKLLDKNVPQCSLDKSPAPMVDTAVIWSSNPNIGKLLSGIDIPVAVLEYSSIGTELIRLNQAYIDAYGNTFVKNPDIIGLEGALHVKKMFDDTVASGKPGVAEFSYPAPNGQLTWIRIRARKVAEIPVSALLVCTFEDITKEKNYERELAKLC